MCVRCVCVRVCARARVCVCVRPSVCVTQGDSGGPLTTPDFDTGLATLTGITSFGKTGCDTNSASVYTRVSYYLDWIKERMQELQA